MAERTGRLKKPQVEDCENWYEIYPGQKHCYNCAARDGYPFRGQPDKNCKNVKLRKKECSIPTTKTISKKTTISTDTQKKRKTTKKTGTTISTTMMNKEG